MSRVVCNRRWLVGAAALMMAVVGLMVTATLRAQDQQFYVHLFPSKDGEPVRDLKAEDLRWREGVDDSAREGEIVSVREYSLPVKVTILVDNNLGADAGFGAAGEEALTGQAGALVHLRSGLTKFFAELPRDVNVELIALAPNPRWLTRATSDPVEIQKAVDLIVPESFPGRFADALIEYADRLKAEFPLTAETTLTYTPVLVAIGSTTIAGDANTQAPLVKMLETFQAYGVMTHFYMFTPGGLASQSDGGNAIIAEALQKLTDGKYHPMATAASSGLNNLLPELGRSLAQQHASQMSQYIVTLERPAGSTGPLKGLQLGVNRPGVTYRLSVNGTLR